MTSVFSGLPNDLIIKIVKETQREAVKTKQEEHKKNLHEELAFYLYWKLKKRLVIIDSDSDSDDEEDFQPDVGCYPWLDETA